MQLKTIFNRVTNFKPFVVERVELTENGPPTIEITMRPRENGLPRKTGRPRAASPQPGPVRSLSTSTSAAPDGQTLLSLRLFKG